MRISSITKNAGKACNNRLYRHIRTFEKIVKNYFVIFKKYMGMSCVQYIKNVRLERAADQFENGETNTLEVALACGFSNLSYFHREFKKKYGMTPKRFISLSARAADFHEIVNNYHFYDS